jgi:hypothetical protein
MMHKHTKTLTVTERVADCYTRPPHLPHGDPHPPPHTTQHTSLFGARRLRQRLCLLPRCLLLLRLLSRCSLLIRLLLCGRCLCLCFCSSRLSNAPTSQLQSQFSYSVLPGNANGHFLSCKSVSIVHRDTGRNFKMGFQLRLFPFPKTTLYSY